MTKSVYVWSGNDVYAKRLFKLFISLHFTSKSIDLSLKYIVFSEQWISASVRAKWLFPNTISTGRFGITTIWKVKFLLLFIVMGTLMVPHGWRTEPSAVVNVVDMENFGERNV